MTKQHEFYKAIEKNDIESCKLLMNDESVNLVAEEHFAIVHASKFGYVEIIKLLLTDKEINIPKIVNWILSIAAKRGYLDVVQLLLNYENLNPIHNNNYSIIQAFKKGNTDIVYLLWDDIRVKKTLKNDNLLLYTQLIKKDIEKKINDFH